MIAGPNDLDRLRKVALLRAVFFATSKKARDRLRAVVMPAEIRPDRGSYAPLVFYEHICERPIVANEKTPDVPILIPYLDRMAEWLGPMAALTDAGRLSALTKWALEAGDCPNPAPGQVPSVKETKKLREFLARKVAFSFDKIEYTKSTKKAHDYLQGAGNQKLAEVWTNEQWKHAFKGLLGIPDADQQRFLAYLYDVTWSLVAHWAESLYITMPIASRSALYGTLIAIVECPVDKNGDGERARLEKKLLRATGKLAAAYLPMLVLFHSAWNLATAEASESGGEGLLKRCVSVFPVAPPYDTAEEFQDALKLEERVLSQHFTIDALGTKNQKELAQRRGLYRMAKKYFTDPKSVGLLTKIAAGSIQIPGVDSRRPLPCALIVGGPGSGKETLFWAIVSWLNHPENGDEIKVEQFNCATVPAGRPGVFLKSLKKMALNGDRPCVVMLDEFNSLDIEAQGVLLRLIEEGKLEPEKNRLRWVLVAVINEEPELLTRESELRAALKNQEILGQFATAYLYESVRGMRRLRDDIYYRFVRHGKFAMPELRDRRADIPAIFLAKVEEELGSTRDGQAVYVDIDLPAYDTLLSPAYEWPGNVRAVEAVAKLVAAQAGRHLERGLANNTFSWVFITAATVREALDRVLTSERRGGAERDRRTAS